MMSGDRFVVAAAFVLVSCSPSLSVPQGAQIVCVSDDNCPAPLTCGTDSGLCTTGDDIACVANGAVLDDGTPCPGADKVCSGGKCVFRGCGDGIVDGFAGEECEPAPGSTCHDDCTIPACGDGRLDPDESCDTASPDCAQCLLLCAAGTADCDGDLLNGCECSLAALTPVVLAERVKEAILVGDDVYAKIGDNDLTSTLVHVAQDGAVTTLLGPLPMVIGGFARVGDHAALLVRPDASQIVVYTITGDDVVQGVEVARNLVGRAAMDDTGFWSCSSAGVERFDAAGNATLALNFAADCQAARMVVCGSIVAASTRGSDIEQLAYDAAHDDVINLGLLTAAVNPRFNLVGCDPEGELVWTDQGIVRRLTALGPEQIGVATFALESDRAAERIVPFAGGIVAPHLHNDDVMQAIWFPPSAGPPQSLAAALPFDGDDTRLLLADDATLFILERP